MRACQVIPLLALDLFQAAAAAVGTELDTYTAMLLTSPQTPCMSVLSMVIPF
jgi:hypothetical protein